MSDDTLNLPNPGDGKYWDVTNHDPDYFVLWLRDKNGKSLRSESIPAFVSYSGGLRAEIKFKADVLMAADAASSVIGTYKFEENN